MNVSRRLFFCVRCRSELDRLEFDVDVGGKDVLIYKDVASARRDESLRLFLTFHSAAGSGYHIKLDSPALRESGDHVVESGSGISCPYRHAEDDLFFF